MITGKNEARLRKLLFCLNIQNEFVGRTWQRNAWKYGHLCIL